MTLASVDRTAAVAAVRLVSEWPELPRLRDGQRLNLKRIRDPLERLYLSFVVMPTVLGVMVLLVVVTQVGAGELAIIGMYPVLISLSLWVAWKLLFAFIVGNSIKVSASQYPQLFSLVTEASAALGITPPTVLIMQGHGLFEVIVAKRFTRRGFVILTSNLLEDLTERGSSRELMFFIGRQLGLMASGYFRFWFVKSVIGRLAFLFYQAWERRCHFTADRLGLLVAGDLYAAEQALITITAGSGIAPITNLEAVKEQRIELFESPWAWLRLAFSTCPYMVDRIVRLREFALKAAHQRIEARAPVAVGALPIAHRRIRALPVMVIHGHDTSARLELENFLFRRFPHVAPLAMIVKTTGAASLPEKFEELAGDVRGAVALLTPDDVVVSTRTGTGGVRPRQNVIVEIGWFWGRLGRNRCLLLARGDVELPSDLAGIEVHRFEKSPTECGEVVRDFIEGLEVYGT